MGGHVDGVCAVLYVVCDAGQVVAGDYFGSVLFWGCYKPFAYVR